MPSFCKTSIVILTHNNLDYTRQCLDSIKEYTDKDDIEVIVVDNNSTDGTPEMLRHREDIKVIYNDKNLGFPAACNQGVEAADVQNDIMLLNNDTVVTKNYLSNLRAALYSSKDIGAVGPVTNFASNPQIIDVTFKNMQKMLCFADEYNKCSNKTKWIPVLRLSGFCMFIKREALDKTGLLDEIFSPGNFEDDDLSLRLISNGYILLACLDTFIYHEGNTTFKITDASKQTNFHNLLKINREKFINKWGFDSWRSVNNRSDLIKLITKHPDEAINVLDVGCGCGAMLLQIKHQFQNSKVYGVEINPNSAKIAKKNADVIIEDIENVNLDFETEYFDYIIFGDILEYLNDPLSVLSNLRKYLKPEGMIIADIKNSMHYTTLYNLMFNKWQYNENEFFQKNNKRIFTLSTIMSMFKSSGYNDLDIHPIGKNISHNDQTFVDLLMTVSSPEYEVMYKAGHYLISAKPV